jgi:hypothetical protein
MTELNISSLDSWFGQYISVSLCDLHEEQKPRVPFIS